MRPKGQHEWECDSHCAITRTDVLLKFKQRWRQLYNADIIFNLTQRLDLHRSMTFKSTCVKAHQDDDQLSGQVLSDAALRNIDVDSLANAYLLATDQPQTRDNAAYVGAQAIIISIQGTRITGRYEDAIREHIDGSYLRH